MAKITPDLNQKTSCSATLPLLASNGFNTFSEMFPGPLGHSLSGKSLNEGIWSLKKLDIREFARDKHRTVDDAPLAAASVWC